VLVKLILILIFVIGIAEIALLLPIDIWPITPLGEMSDKIKSTIRYLENYWSFSQVPTASHILQICNTSKSKAIHGPKIRNR
jgi:hypothetical protein